MHFVYSLLPFIEITCLSVDLLVHQLAIACFCFAFVFLIVVIWTCVRFCYHILKLYFPSTISPVTQRVVTAQWPSRQLPLTGHFVCHTSLATTIWNLKVNISLCVIQVVKCLFFLTVSPKMFMRIKGPKRLSDLVILRQLSSHEYIFAGIWWEA